jgi:hypothetical protein
MKKIYIKIIYLSLFSLLILPSSSAVAAIFYNSPSPLYYQANDFNNNNYGSQSYWNYTYEPHVYPRSRRFCQSYVTYGNYCMNTTRCYKYKGRQRECYFYRDCRNRPYYETSCSYTRLFGE